ncbi:hypothetical protein [Caulobacter sp. RHG1]|uniref:hypothetical protein n=1 Tax=Caulobacter sp. (strain RHG1) TaxID=2545762 RepID=UPI001553F912|nr:hypothetical protein [Caulobacter sp. RHG1]NQE61627.1 hypothetical protein [Caulobacter sp. RHG1]
MRKFVTLVLAAAAVSAAAAPAFAQEARWSDAKFLSAQRCAGLAKAKGLEPIDASALEAQIKAQTPGRQGLILERGEVGREQAMRAGRAPSETMKAKLLAERAACIAYATPQLAAN